MKRIDFRNIPERSLEPPEDGRQVYADCSICEESIKEFDDCVELPNHQCICMNCINKYTKLEVTL